MTDNLHYAFDGIWHVLLASLVFGAALPAVFALGIRSLAWTQGSTAYDGVASSHRPHALGRAVAGLCFVVVLGGVVLGITIIAATGMGKSVSFESGYPTIVEKEG